VNIVKRKKENKWLSRKTLDQGGGNKAVLIRGSIRKRMEEEKKKGGGRSRGKKGVTCGKKNHQDEEIDGPRQKNERQKKVVAKLRAYSHKGIGVRNGEKFPMNHVASPGKGKTGTIDWDNERL